MERVFYFCAILGSVFVVLQFAAGLLGLAGGADADGSAVDVDVDGDGAPDDPGLVDASHDSSGAHFLRAFSIRTVSAGVAFFGFAGLAATQAGMSSQAALAIGVVVGLIAIYGVYRMLRMLSAYNHDGSVRMETAVGAHGQAYLRVPGSRGGVGKVTILQQGRSMEYDAVTDYEELEPNAPIVVLEILSPSLLLVKRRVD